MEAPPRINPVSAGDYLAVMTRAIIQGGISWSVVDAKWDGIQEACHGFDAERVADLTEPEIDALASIPAVIRVRRKIEATAGNARRILEIEDEFGGFKAFLAQYPTYEEQVKALRSNFRYLGETGCYYFLYVIGQDVPPHDEWRRGRAG